jgi:hypothetical protein
MYKAPRVVRRRLLIGFALVIVVVPACGGSQPAKADYIHRADAICVKANDQVRALQPQGPLAEQAKTTKRVNDIQRKAINQVAALARPSADDSRLGKDYEMARQALNLGDASVDAMIAGDQSRENDSATRAATLVRQANADMAAYGLTECSK